MKRRLSANEGGVVELIIDEMIERLAPASDSPVHGAAALHVLARLEAKIDGYIVKGERAMSDLQNKLDKLDQDLADHKAALDQVVTFVTTTVPALVQKAVDDFKAANPDVASGADLTHLDELASTVEAETSTMVSLLPAAPSAPAPADQAPPSVE